MPKQYTATVSGQPWSNQTELAWCAGFFDGEGCFSLQTNGGYKWVRVTIGQNNKVVLERFQAAVGGLGRIHKGAITKGGNQHWQFSVTKWGDVQLVVAFLWKFLSPVKRQQALDKFREYRAYQNA